MTNAPDHRATRQILAGLVLVTTFIAPAGAVQGQRQQQVNPAPVNYWMDVSTGERGGGGGMMGGLAGMMAGRGGAGDSGGFAGYGGTDNWFGAAQHPTPGRFVDIAVFDRRRPGTVTATQTVPAGARIGPTLPLLPPPPPVPDQASPWDEPTREPPGEPGRMPRITVKYYWGCGAAVRTGQPRVASFDANTMRAYGEFLRGRSEPDRGATSNSRSSTWPNREAHRAWPSGASLVGEHAVSGAGLPASLRFQISQAQDFMGELGLRSEGRPTGVLTLSWSGLPTATGYFANAMGMEVDASARAGRSGDVEEMTMIFWSASETPDPGDGLMGFLSNANQERFLSDRTLLSPGTTSCQVPAGIFANTMMVNIGAVAYGRELNLVHPARPTDPRTPWNQEWTARIRVKSASSVMMIPGMGPAMAAGSRTGAGAAPASPDPALTPAQQAEAERARRQAACDAARERQRADASAVGGAVGGSFGGLAGRALGGLVGGARQPPECEGLDTPRPQRRRN